ncbi:hypothetical protein EV177_000148 [Coemansia sp. RSA 1804]|nr:hypothetical protein EV177_000148 [Coemansia sp. RSA 1804]
MPPFSLKNIDIQFPIGGFSIIAGPTGSGKSSLLSALIGEITLVHGNIMVPTVDSRVATAAAADGNMYKDVMDIANVGLVLHDIAYVGQDTWLRNATFRENILFGEEYDKERYEEVLRVCALKPDLRIFPAGDETEIGERGVTLSGGQRQRVALARAVYSHRRILLIDDCLSAVDAHTGKHILMECLLSKTKLMQGRTRVLITHHVPMCLPYADFMVMMNNGRVVLKGAPQDLKAQGVLTSALEELDDKAKNAHEDKQPADEKDDGKDKNIETNKKSTISDLDKSLFNLKSEDEYTEERLRKIAAQKNLDPNIDLAVLQGILVKEEEREKVMHAAPRFFDTTPAGRIISRFSGDMDTIDEGAISSLIGWAKGFVSLAATLLDQEAASESTLENKPPVLWPKTGNVEFENLVAEYVPGVPVLHGISLSVRHGEKVGVVGRTGAGKSTMSLALMRFVEATKGRIVLDGIDISKIGLDDLRRNITIIPQDPVLFNGTIRYNIDPFEEYPDELIWDALNRVHMTREQTSHAMSASTSIVGVSNDENGELPLERMAGVFSSLDDKIEQNGHSLSAGQRQLVAMARALVRRSKLIIMDEATASVDFDTDERLQRTIRGYEFANSTLLCIAHRLRTVIDYDRVLVLDKGKVAEFDTPKNLLKKKGGIFRGMCEKSGELEHLVAATK